MSKLQDPAPTFDDVWRTIQELAQMGKETDRKFQETERLMKEGWAETDRKFQETDRKFQETERLIKEGWAETDRKFQETDRKFQETDRKFQETDRKFQETDSEIEKAAREVREAARQIKEVNKKLGELGNRLGEFVEHMVAPAVVRLFQGQGIEVHEVHPGVEANRNGEAIEIDLLVVNDGVLVAVECKSKLTHEHVEGHLARMGKLKQLLPHYSQCQAFGAVAAMVMSESVKTYAKNQGLYVLYQNGDSVEVGNPQGFNPKVW